jgi:hypothetical protein
LKSLSSPSEGNKKLQLLRNLGRNIRNDLDAVPYNAAVRGH